MKERKPNSESKEEEDASKIIWNDRTTSTCPSHRQHQWDEMVKWSGERKSKINDHIPFSFDDGKRRCNKTTVHFQQVKHFMKITLISWNPDLIRLVIIFRISYNNYYCLEFNLLALIILNTWSNLFNSGIEYSGWKKCWEKSFSKAIALFQYY